MRSVIVTRTVRDIGAKMVEPFRGTADRIIGLGIAAPEDNADIQRVDLLGRRPVAAWLPKNGNYFRARETLTHMVAVRGGSGGRK